MSLADQSLQFFPVSARVSVLQARGLRIKGKDGTNDAYTALQAGRETFRTPVAEKRAEPVWGGDDATFIFTLPAEIARPDQVGVPLQVRVLHRVPLGADKLLGLTVINVHELRKNSARENPQWFKLLNKAGKADKERGEVLLDIQFLKSSMSVSMIDLSEKSHSRLGKFKDKLRGKKKDGLSDSASAILPSVSQVLTDSEGEMNEETDGETTKKKKNKLKSLFVPKSNMKRNSLSQSMSSLGTLPDKNSSISSSTSSGLNVEPSEGKKKKKFTFLTHKRTGSTDSKASNHSDFTFGSSNQNPPSQIDICINGSHVNREETQSKTMQEMEEEEEEEGEEEEAEDRWRREEAEQERMEEEKRREAEGERKRKEKEEQRRKEEEEKERIRREKEEYRRRMEEEEKERIRVDRVKEEQKRRMDEEEKERMRMEREKEEQRRKMEEEKERIRMKREKEEEIRMLDEEKEKERIRNNREKEEQKRRIDEEEQERIRLEREREEQRRRMEEKEKERIRMEIEREEQRRRTEEEKERQMIEKEEQKRKLEEEERISIKREKEAQIIKLAEERKRKEEREAEELRRKMKEENDRKKAEEEQMRIAEEERMKEEKKRAEREQMIKEEEKKKEEKRIEMERRLADERKAREEEERRVAEAKEKQRKEDERVREENERKRAEMEKKRKEEEQERRNLEIEEKNKREKQMREEQERKEENLFEESIIPQSSDFTRSARLSNVKPSVSISETVSQPSMANTNPFLDDNLDASVSENVISVEETSAKKGRAPLPPQLTGPDVFSRAASKQHFHLTEVSKHPAPQPPGILKMTKEVPVKENTNQAGLGQEAKKTLESHHESKDLSVAQDDTQVDTNPFTYDRPVAIKHNKRPAPKPRIKISMSENNQRNGEENLTEDTVHIEEKASDLINDLSQREEHLEDIVEPDSAKPNASSCIHPNLDPETVVCKTNGLTSMEGSQKKSRAPLPPTKPKRTGDPSILYKQPALLYKTNLEQVQENRSNKMDQVSHVEMPAVSTPSSSTVSSSTFSSLAEKSQVKEPCATESVETGSGSGSRTLPWVKVVPSDAGELREQVAHTSVIRQHAVKPLSAAENQPESHESGVSDNMQPKTKAAEAAMKGPFSQLTKTELISLALRQQEQISQRDARIQELEQYIDNLLVRVMEEKPSILMSLNAKNKSI